MSPKKILVVIGATGNQGGSVVNAVLEDSAAASQFEIHALVRDPSKPTAKALAERGVHLVKGELNNKDELRAAFKGAYAVYSLTNWADGFDIERSIVLGKNVADIAKESNIQHLIWSTLPNVKEVSGGKYPSVANFDSKAEVEAYIRTLGVPASFIQIGTYNDLITSMMVTPRGGESKAYKLSLPVPTTTELPLISASRDVGKYVRSHLLNREMLLGKVTPVAERYYSIEEMAAILRQNGVDVVAETCTEDEYKQGLIAAGLPSLLQNIMTDLMKFIVQYGYFAGADLKAGHELLTEPLETFSEWAAKDPSVAAMR